MKKRILFMAINMNVGGTEKALLNMISEMSPDEYDITLFMLEEYGGFLDSIPDYVNVTYFKGYSEIKELLKNPPLKTVKNFFSKGKFINAINLFAIYLLTKVFSNNSLFLKYLLRYCPKIPTEYDVAVAYAGPMDFISYFVVNKISAKKKVQWIHFDVTKIGFNKGFAANIYKEFDKIFVVSEQGNQKLSQVLPNLKSKIETFHNIISPTQIAEFATEGDGFQDNFNGVRILTVGRLSKEKGQDLAIKVLARLKKEGHKVKWYCIGDGYAKHEYKELIEKYGLDKDFILLGTNPNPYPYMKQCDIYIQPSRHEGFCITLAEAKCFNNPIITTDFTGAREQIDDDITGLIVSFDENQLYNAIKRLLFEETLRFKIKKHLEDENYNTNKKESLNDLVKL